MAAGDHLAFGGTRIAQWGAVNTIDAGEQQSFAQREPREHRESRTQLRAKPSVAVEIRDPVQGERALARLSELGAAVSVRIQTRPLESLALAVGVGFVAGGALTFRAGRAALAVAVRHAAREVLKQVL